MINLKTLNSRINIEALLNKIGYNGESKTQGKELRIICIIHKSDNQTSMAIDTVNNIFYCHNCGAKGDLIQLYTDSTGSEQKYAIEELSVEFMTDKPTYWTEISMWLLLFCSEYKVQILRILRATLYSLNIYDVDTATGRAVAIERIRIIDESKVA